MDQPALVDTLIGFARTLARGYDISDVLHELTERVTAVLEITGAGVCLVHQERLRFVAGDSTAFGDLELLQERTGTGPCVDALTSAAPVLIDRLGAHAGRWPAYAQRAAELGIHSVASLPMCLDTPIGTLGLYRREARAWTANEVGVARVFADIGASYVRTASALLEQRRTSEQLQAALDSRVIIEQAKGIVAAQRGISVDQAFAVLRKHANDRNLQLRLVAEAVVKLGLRP
jgi:hypothetical protein